MFLLLLCVFVSLSICGYRFQRFDKLKFVGRSDLISIEGIEVNKLIIQGILITVLFFISGIATQDCFAQKLTVEEVVARHLDSIGSAEARASIKSRVIQGASLATMRIGGSGQARGGAVMASQGQMSLIGIIFGPQDYSNEKAAYDGKRLTLGELPGMRTNLGAFFVSHDSVFKEGLVGGTLSSAWPLLNLSDRDPKLKYAGTKKIDGRQVHLVEYEPRRGGNLDILLFFDAETFQHVRTEYKRDIVAPTVTQPDKAARQKETHIRFREDFSDFRAEGGLVLPHTYKIQLSFDREASPMLQDWVLTLSQFLFNKELDVKQFDATAK